MRLTFDAGVLKCTLDEEGIIHVIFDNKDVYVAIHSPFLVSKAAFGKSFLTTDSRNYVEVNATIYAPLVAKTEQATFTENLVAQFPDDAGSRLFFTSLRAQAECKRESVTSDGNRILPGLRILCFCWCQ
jgi:hypothetical protein